MGLKEVLVGTARAGDWGGVGWRGPTRTGLGAGACQCFCVSGFGQRWGLIRSGWAAASRAGCAGGVLRLVVTRPVDESTRWPCASGRACSSSLARWAARRSTGVADRRPQQFGRRLVGGE